MLLQNLLTWPRKGEEKKRYGPVLLWPRKKTFPLPFFETKSWKAGEWAGLKRFRSWLIADRVTYLLQEVFANWE